MGCNLDNIFSNTMKPPTLPTVKKRFAKAKEIRCLNLDTIIGVAQAKQFTYNEADNSWNVGVVCFWRDGQYAEITKKKCDKPCGKCKECGEKRKLKNQ